MMRVAACGHGLRHIMCAFRSKLVFSRAVCVRRAVARLTRPAPKAGAPTFERYALAVGARPDGH